MEKLLSPSFFESENVTEIYSDIITATLPKTKHKELPEPVNFTVFHKKLNCISFCVILWSLQPTLVNMKSDISQSKDTRDPRRPTLAIPVLNMNDKGQSREMFFLRELNKDLVNNPDIVLPEKAVTNALSMIMPITENISPDKAKEDQVKTANMVLRISEGLVSALVEPKSQENNTESRKTVKTPTMALMSVNGMEKLLSPSFFESENVTEIYSDIITATLPKTKHRELPEPVNFTVFHKKKFQAGLVTCVYWKEQGEETHWSVNGCTASFSNESLTVCSCTHLSTFALLLQTEEQEEDSSLLEVVNLFCMSVGLAFLALAILTFLLCTWNPKINNTARLHLSICLFLGHLLFLVGVSRTENAVACAVIAGMLHFLFLSSFVWMLLETLQLFMLVRSLSKVQVIQKEGLRALYLLLVGYGAPLVVVGVSAAVYSDGYGSKGACWLQNEKNFSWSFIGPVAAILALNLVSFCVVIWSLLPTLANMKSDISQSRDTRLIIFKIVAQFLILGCTWILGFFQRTSVLKYLFVILNSQQGTFIFIVHCLLNKEVREEYRRWLSCLCRTEGPSGGRHKENDMKHSGTVTSFLSIAMSVVHMPPAEGKNADVSSILLKITEGLVEPTKTQTNKSMKTPTMGNTMDRSQWLVTAACSIVVKTHDWNPQGGVCSHPVFLSSFVWMLLETLQLFLLVRSLSKVQAIQKEGLRALYLLLIGYGAPLVVVGVSAAVYSEGYGSKDM
ncbi:adhesion G protein-coupled receptor E3-like [Conger conger]|uniref:adhesion G protein-coupled receptor E3-like n=1 Tax=Conger conger TaxID=82655 RepID=UPI002A598A52|nr:adhesion G protein-coupled receptor E3-like [Conger conger]